MYTFRSFSELPLDEAVSLWNSGFEGYYIPIRLTADSLISRMAGEQLSPVHSLVVCADGQPVGFVMNGFRTVDGRKHAWNGGTGVISAYRGRGAGKALMARNVELYRELGVHRADLEAFVQNTPAIRLYQSAGYEILGEVVFLEASGALGPEAFSPSETAAAQAYTVSRGLPREVSGLPFYRGDSAWQTQWQSAANGESLLLQDSSDGGRPAGYALFKKTYDEQQTLTAISLLQCEVRADMDEDRAREAVNLLLQGVFAPAEDSCRRLAVNLSAMNRMVLDALMQSGFSVKVRQVHMRLTL